MSPSAPDFPTPLSYVLPRTRETKFYIHTQQANQNCIREEIKNRLISGKPATLSSRVLSSCLLFKNEVHRNMTLLVEWGRPTGSVLGNLGQGRRENCVRRSLWLVLYTESCVGDEMWENCIGRGVWQVWRREKCRETRRKMTTCETWA